MHTRNDIRSPIGRIELGIRVSSHVELGAFLDLPRHPKGLVIFAHGSGSSRFSRRNQFVSRFLVASGFGTLLMDLLTAKEEKQDVVTRELRFDIELLAQRVASAVDWAAATTATSALEIGLFGASTGAAAALKCAARRAERVKAVVSRGGRPDLAGELLADVQAPTLLIVGENDTEVIRLNHWAMQRMHAVTDLAIVPGATHLFEEPGTLEQAAEHAATWFDRYLHAQLS